MKMQYRIYATNDDGSFLSQGVIEASSARAAIETFCENFRLNEDGLIALAPGESLPEGGALERKFNADGIEYDYE